jgi:PIN domain nuclease of toxin-antitoxin system
MEIVVSDTQILIDMHSAGLLELVSKSAMHFHTVDYVIAELNRSPYQRPIIGQMVSDGSLKVYSYDAKDNALLLEFFENYSCKTNLSITDCAVLKYAKDNGYRMLTGDRIWIG